MSAVDDSSAAAMPDLPEKEEDAETAEITTASPPKKKPKKKKVSQVGPPSKCAICDIVLNSEQQATQHYSGKTHLKNLKKLNLAITPENTPGYSERVISQNELEKPITTEPISKDPKAIPDQSSNSSGSMDPVSKAILDNALGILPTSRKVEITCAVCNLTFTSETHANSHFGGIKHAKKVLNSRKRPGDESTDDLFTGDADSTTAMPTKKKKEPVIPETCEICKVTLTGKEQATAHYNGKNHLNKLLKIHKPELSAEASDKRPFQRRGIGYDMLQRGSGRGFGGRGRGESRGRGEARGRGESRGRGRGRGDSDRGRGRGRGFGFKKFVKEETPSTPAPPPAAPYGNTQGEHWQANRGRGRGRGGSRGRGQSQVQGQGHENPAPPGDESYNYNYYTDQSGGEYDYSQSYDYYNQGYDQSAYPAPAGDQSGSYSGWYSGYSGY